MRIKDLAKGAIRNLVPPHIRFQRAGREFLRSGEREVHELPKLVEPGTVAVDVGSLIGDYAYSLCPLVGPEGLVLCIEPQPTYAKLLRSAAAHLKLPMRVVECALSSQPGFAELNVPVVDGRNMSGFASLDHRSTQGATVRVELRRLDDITTDLPKRISFLKVDVEGHELEVFKGGVETLRRHRPNLLVEIEARHSPVPITETFAFIRQQSYEGFYLDDQRQRIALDHFDPDKNRALASSERAGGQTQAGYVSNFIFIPA